MRLLIIAPYLPHPRVGHGGGTAVRQQIQALAQRHDITLLALRRPNDPPGDEADLGAGVQVETVPFLDHSAGGAHRLALYVNRAAAVAHAWRQGHPFYAAKYERCGLQNRALELVDALDPDVVQVEYLQLASVLRDLAAARGDSGRPRLILSSHEHGALPRRRRARAAGWPRRALLEAEARAWDRLGRDASGWADAVLCVTDQDRELFAATGATGLVTVPLGIDTHRLQPVPVADGSSPRMLFLGSFGHAPNCAAAAVLCRDIWPAVVRRLPDWRLSLAGPGSREFLAALPEKAAGITAEGFVDDLEALFGAHRLFVAPLFEGGGIKIKILEAMARGIPVVTTPVGAEGIATREQDLVGWATTPAEFVERVVEAAHDPQRAAERARRARRHVVDQFDWGAVASRLEAVYRAEPPVGG